MVSIRKILRKLGPGLITGASDDDPSGIATYAMAGARLGTSLLWTAPLSFPLMAAVQYICAKIGLVAGCGIAGVLRKHYGAWLLYPAVLGLFVANSFNAGADIAAIASGINLLHPVSERALLLPIALAILVLQAFGTYRMIANIFKWLTLALFAYIGSAILARPDLRTILHDTLIPKLSFDHTTLAMLTAVMGTTISPYLFFWQADQEVEEMEEKKHRRSRTRRRDFWRRRGPSDSQLTYAAADVGIGMMFSTLVMYSIILATAATLHRHGGTEIETAAQAAQALRPIAGDMATVLMAIGLIGSGFLAVPILTSSAAYALAEAFHWKCSLDETPGRAPEFYGAIAASTLCGLAIHVLGIGTVKALYWTAVINGLLAPPLLVMIMLISGNREIMGARVNGRGLATMGWITTALMWLAAAGTFIF